MVRTKVQRLAQSLPLLHILSTCMLNRVIEYLWLEVVFREDGGDVQVIEDHVAIVTCSDRVVYRPNKGHSKKSIHYETTEATIIRQY